MQSKQVTPGPWRIGDAGRTVFGPPNGEPSPITVANVRTRADARLIRAAPELYDALRAVAPFCPIAVQDKIAALIERADGKRG